MEWRVSFHWTRFELQFVEFNSTAVSSASAGSDGLVGQLASSVRSSLRKKLIAGEDLDQRTAKKACREKIGRSGVDLGFIRARH